VWVGLIPLSGQDPQECNLLRIVLPLRPADYAKMAQSNSVYKGKSYLCPLRHLSICLQWPAANAPPSIDSIQPKPGRQIAGEVNRKKQLHVEYGVDAPPSQRPANAVSAASRNFGSILRSGHEDRSKCRSPAKRRCVGRLHPTLHPRKFESEYLSLCFSREDLASDALKLFLSPCLERLERQAAQHIPVPSSSEEYAKSQPSIWSFNTSRV
jgi:hypothetical protein